MESTDGLTRGWNTLVVQSLKIRWCKPDVIQRLGRYHWLGRSISRRCSTIHKLHPLMSFLLQKKFWNRIKSLDPSALLEREGRSRWCWSWEDCPKNWSTKYCPRYGGILYLPELENGPVEGEWPFIVKWVNLALSKNSHGLLDKWTEPPGSTMQFLTGLTSGILPWCRRSRRSLAYRQYAFRFT